MWTLDRMNIHYHQSSLLVIVILCLLIISATNGKAAQVPDVLPPDTDYEHGLRTDHIGRIEVAGLKVDLATVDDRGKAEDKISVILNEYDKTNPQRLARQSVCYFVEGRGYAFTPESCDIIRNLREIIMTENITFDDFDRLRRRFESVIQILFLQTFTFRLTHFKSYDNFNIKFKRPSTPPASLETSGTEYTHSNRWSKVIRIRRDDMTCEPHPIAGERCLWTPADRRKRFIIGLSPS